MPTMTAIIEDPTIEQNVIIIGLSTAVLFGKLLKYSVDIAITVSIIQGQL